MVLTKSVCQSCVHVMKTCELDIIELSEVRLSGQENTQRVWFILLFMRRDNIYTSMRVFNSTKQNNGLEALLHGPNKREDHYGNTQPTGGENTIMRAYYAST